MNSNLRIHKKYIIEAFAIIFFVILIFVSPTICNANPTINEVSNENSMDAEVNIKTSTDVVTQLYNAMVSRETDFTIYCNNPEDVVNKIYDESLFWEASAIDSPNTSDDFDYLYYNVDQYSATPSSDGVNVSITWSEDANQLQQVNTKVDEILNETGVRNMDNAYDIAKTLHDYVVKVTNYDYSFKKYTAYNALFDKKTVCQGYSLLYYKLLEEAGVSSRFILGTAEGENHCWLIVKIGDLYYNVDPTWDDTESSSISYDYFLKGSNSFDKDHTRTSKFSSEEFTTNYPTSTSNFSKSGYTGNDVNIKTNTSSQTNDIVSNDTTSPEILTDSTTNTYSDTLVDTQTTEDTQATNLNSNTSTLVDTNTQLPTSNSRVIENENGLLIQIFE